MPRGDKSKYTDKQKRQAEHIEESYESRSTRKGGRRACVGDGEQRDGRRKQIRQRSRSSRYSCVE